MQHLLLMEILSGVVGVKQSGASSSSSYSYSLHQKNQCDEIRNSQATHQPTHTQHHKPFMKHKHK